MMRLFWLRDDDPSTKGPVRLIQYLQFIQQVHTRSINASNTFLSLASLPFLCFLFPQRAQPWCNSWLRISIEWTGSLIYFLRCKQQRTTTINPLSGKHKLCMAHSSVSHWPWPRDGYTGRDKSTSRHSIMIKPLSHLCHILVRCRCHIGIHITYINLNHHLSI